MNLKLIKTYCESRPGGIKQLAKDCGISESNLHRSIRIGDITLSTLERIAHEPHVDILTFVRDSTHEELLYWKPRLRLYRHDVKSRSEQSGSYLSLRRNKIYKYLNII